ncbi:MAG: Cutinase [Thermoleophilia bacterium]|nr:Cutinase [Thermoleophilia bacterium]
MGGVPGILRFGIAATSIGVAGSIALNLTSRHGEALEAARTARNEGVKPSKQELPSDELSANADGLARLLAVGTAVGSLALAGAFALGKRPGAAIASLGVATGAAGAALLGGSGPLDTRIERNAASTLQFVSSRLHAEMKPTQPDFATQLPTVDSSAAGKPPRPSEQELRAAKLKHVPGTPDLDEAKRQADAVIAKIDWDKQDILMWLPGTYTHNMANNWIKYGEERFTDGSVVMMDYPATLDFESSVSTGMETLRLVLAEVARRDGDHRVMLGGHSQGAWIIGDAMATPEIRGMVDRAVLYGNPGLAKEHYDDRDDAQVVELNDPNDVIAAKVADRAGFIDAMGAMEQGIDATNVLGAVGNTLANPKVSAYWAVASMDAERWVHSDPHQYYYAYRDGLSWLDTGTVEPKS